jgi:hypothetical protein
MKYLLAVLVLMLASVPALAGPTAGKLIESCNSKDALMRGLCIGYFTGVADASSGLDITMDNGDIVKVIYADGVTVQQCIHVFVKYVSEHPEIENKPASGVYVDALVKAKLIGFQRVAKKAVDQ